MTLSKSRLVPFLCAVTVTLGFVLAAACSGQGEGERCDIRADNNGTDDCAGTLVCTAKGSLNGSDTDRCCPGDRTQATTTVCQLQSAGGIDAAAPVPDSGPAEGGTDGGGNDAAKDGAADADGDAPDDTGATDAPADG